jgi:hypothetical protein
MSGNDDTNHHRFAFSLRTEGRGGMRRESDSSVQAALASLQPGAALADMESMEDAAVTLPRVSLIHWPLVATALMRGSCKSGDVQSK